jgi:hypothetical protein
MSGLGQRVQILGPPGEVSPYYAFVSGCPSREENSISKGTVHKAMVSRWQVLRQVGRTRLYPLFVAGSESNGLLDHISMHCPSICIFQAPHRDYSAEPEICMVGFRSLDRPHYPGLGCSPPQTALTVFVP